MKAYSEQFPQAKRMERWRFGVERGPFFGMKGNVTMDGWFWAIRFPMWVVVILSSLLPAMVLLRDLKRRREILPGHCRTRGYDLRATPERCPECGAVQASGVEA